MAGDLGQRRVLQVGQPGAVLVDRRQEEVPQAALARLRLELLDDRRGAPPVIGLLDLLAEARLRGVHALVHEREQPLAQLQRRGVEGEVHDAPSR